MNTVWILIFVAKLGSGTAVTNIEFTSKEKCETARQVLIKDEWVPGWGGYTYCVEK